MREFIPGAESDEQRDRLRAAIVEKLEKTHNVRFGPERVCRLRLAQGGDVSDVSVGQPHPVTRDPVLVILWEDERALYHICTQRSVTTGIPILAPLHSVREVEYFTD